jgi:catechol 2,3-dioxygenase-like lactoylglutathione lyase family enzyme
MTTPALRISTVTIPVADQDRALAFYRDVLGFEVRADNAYGDQRWLSVAPAGSPVDFTLHLPFPGRGEPGWQQGLVLQTDDIAGVVAALRGAGTEVTEPEQAGWGTQAQFSDPDGNGFVLLQQGLPDGASGDRG